MEVLLPRAKLSVWSFRRRVKSYFTLGYINPLNTTLVFDVTLTRYASGANQTIRFQNCIQSLFSRVRLLYGATPLEDIINYNQIMRNLTEWTSTNNNGVMDQMSISDGVGGYVTDIDGTGIHMGLVNTRQKYIQGIDEGSPTGSSNFFGGAEFLYVGDPNPPSAVPVTNPTNTVTRRYQVNFGLGMFNQDKLVSDNLICRSLPNSWRLNWLLKLLWNRLMHVSMFLLLVMELEMPLPISSTMLI